MNDDILKKLEEIRSRVKPDVKATKSSATEQTTETDYKGVHIVDNVETGSYQLFFRSFPSSAVRTYLKRHGFQWLSANDQCWSCERSTQAIFHAEKAIDKMMRK